MSITQEKGPLLNVVALQTLYVYLRLWFRNQLCWRKERDTERDRGREREKERERERERERESSPQ